MNPARLKSEIKEHEQINKLKKKGVDEKTIK